MGLLFVIIAALVYQQVFFTHQLDQLSVSVDDLGKNLNTKINTVAEENQQAIGEVVSSLRQLDQSLESFKSSSDIRLGELKKELGTVQSASGDFSLLIEDVIKSVVSVDAFGSLGSGAIIHTDGFIVTNYHVVEKKNSFKVLTYDGELHTAKLIGYSSPYDVAVLKIDNSEGYPALEYGNNDDVKVGEKVIAVGNPLGLSFSVTEGIISGVNRGREDGPGTYLQTDVSINPGNSGGPLINKAGEIVGINNFKISGDLIEGLGFALYADDAKKVSDGVISEYQKVV